MNGIISRDGRDDVGLRRRKIMIEEHYLTTRSADVQHAELEDIQSREDIERLVRTFYDQAIVDDKIGYIFTEVAHLDLDAHLPTMFSFWETLLLGARSYNGGAMQKHVALSQKSSLGAEHFNRWLELWGETVDGLFAGDKAEEAKVKAGYIARSMLLRVGQAARGEPSPYPKEYGKDD
jgi:hemoglobin